MTLLELLALEVPKDEHEDRTAEIVLRELRLRGFAHAELTL